MEDLKSFKKIEISIEINKYTKLKIQKVIQFKKII